MKFIPHQIEENVNVSKYNAFKEFLKLSIGLTAIVLVAYLVLGFAAERIAERLPLNTEKILGRAFVVRLDNKNFTKTQTYVQSVLDKLTRTGQLPPYDYKIWIIEDERVNALALPGGNIVILSGLLRKVKNENELAAILAHELGHYAHRDHLRGLGRGLVLLSITSAMGMSGEVPNFIITATSMFDLQFSRDQEAAADVFGLELMMKTYHHVGGVVSAFDALLKEGQKTEQAEFFSTHPDPLRRQRSLEGQINVMKYPQSNPISFPLPGFLPLDEEIQVLSNN